MPGHPPWTLSILTCPSVSQAFNSDRAGPKTNLNCGERGYFASLSLFHARLSCSPPRWRLRKDTGTSQNCQPPLRLNSRNACRQARTTASQNSKIRVQQEVLRGLRDLVWLPESALWSPEPKRLARQNGGIASLPVSELRVEQAKPMTRFHLGDQRPSLQPSILSRLLDRERAGPP